jgi:hypothetical protein
MEWIGLLFSCWEFYALGVPYLVFGGWAYRAIGRRQYTSMWALFWTGISFLVIFLAGFFAVTMVAAIIIMFRHAEKL